MMEKNEERIIVNRFKLLDKIGVGGMGDIYLADDLQLSRQVAIKTIKNEFKENVEVCKRIDRECHLHATLGVHPNIVALHDRIDQDGDIYLILEYVKGETLTNRLKRYQEMGLSFSIEEVVALICQILDALAHIHSNEILHRDIKPSNIMLVDKKSGTATAKLMDFGIAYLDSDDSAFTQITALTTGGGPGTPAYMAPERIDAETFGECGPATDLYSVGIILYELLVNAPPFHGTMTKILTGHLTREPNLVDLPDSVPDSLLSVLKKSLEKQQENRFQDALAFSASLKQCLTDTTTPGFTSNDDQSEILEKTVLSTDQKVKAIKEAMADVDKAKQQNTKKKKIWWPSCVAAILLFCLAIAWHQYFRQKPSPISAQSQETSIDKINVQPMPSIPSISIKDSSSEQIPKNSIDKINVQPMPSIPSISINEPIVPQSVKFKTIEEAEEAFRNLRKEKKPRRQKKPQKKVATGRKPAKPISPKPNDNIWGKIDESTKRIQ